MADNVLLGPAAVKEYARRHTLTAMRTIVNLCQNAKKDSTRLAAAKELLDRGWGRSVQAITYETSEGSELLTILQESHTKALQQFGTPVMIERIEGETLDEMVNKPSRSTRPRLKKDDI